MWPLAFAREENVRTAVLDAWHDLYLTEADPKKKVGVTGCVMGWVGGWGEGGGAPRCWTRGTTSVNQKVGLLLFRGWLSWGVVTAAFRKRRPPKH
jgi:hypothetical protein